jgi:hypothetical protein
MKRHNTFTKLFLAFSALLLTIALTPFCPRRLQHPHPRSAG